MAIRYQVSTWNSSTATEAREYRELKRLDAAQNELWSQIYSMLEGDGALDTERGQRLQREFAAFCNSPHPLPKHNTYYSNNFALRSDCHGMLAHVKFVAIRTR